MRLEKGYLFENGTAKRLDELPEPVRMEGREHSCKTGGSKTSRIKPKNNQVNLGHLLFGMDLVIH